jgi:SDR family mycofactocin-dependent oxidoreductase
VTGSAAAVTGRVAGKVALVTGAARGQGRAHCVRLAQEGADIVATDLCGPVPGAPCAAATEEDLAETVRLVADAGGRVVSFVADVRDLPALRAGVDDAVAQLGRLDVVVANAGVCIPAAWDQVTPAVFDDTMSINVTGVWNTVMVSAPHVVRAGGGSIVLVSSAAGLKAAPFMVPYTTSKFAVRGMTKAFAAELAQHSVRVNSLHPTGVDTPMTQGGLRDLIEAAAAGNPRLGGMSTNMLPVPTTEPEAVAEAVLWLASDESRYTTAHELAVDAGLSQY